MSHKIMLVAAAALAALALSAVGASAASAAEFHCTSTSASCFATGEQTTQNVFTVKLGKVKCTGATFKGTGLKTTKSIELEPAYTGCTAFGVAAEVTPNGCKYKFEVTGTTSPYVVATSVVCASGGKITVKPKAGALNCTVKVGAQTGLTGVTVTNSETAEPTDINALVNVHNITYTEEGTECAGTGAATGVYEGGATIKGYEDNSGVEGAQVGLHVF
jgi:hypothetical protein